MFVYSNLKNYSFTFDVHKIYPSFPVKNIKFPQEGFFYYKFERSKLNYISIIHLNYNYVPENIHNIIVSL